MNWLNLDDKIYLFFIRYEKKLGWTINNNGVTNLLDKFYSKKIITQYIIS